MRRRLPIATLLVLAACGNDERSKSSPAPAASAVPAWAHVAKEQIAEAGKLKVPVAFENSIGMRFVLIPSGTFRMGSPESGGGFRDERPQHDVTLTKPYYLSIWATTNAQYRRFDRSHDGGVQFGESMNGDKQPVVKVSYDDAAKFSTWLNGRDHEHTYRLPTEAEREHATRAGTTTRFWVGETIDPPNARAAGTATVAVGTFPPNPWGLYEMAENVAEWCADWYGEYPKGPVTAPTGPDSGSDRVLRSGKNCDGLSLIPSAFRFGKKPDTRFEFFGFRVVASAAPPR